jgi:uncharacterized protein
MVQEPKQFRTNQLYADLYKNEGKQLVVIIGGSSAGIWSHIDPSLMNYLTANYNVLVFAYFGVKGLPEYLKKVPLEYFINGINQVKDMLMLSDTDITFIGNSKGAEATLLIVSKYFNRCNTVACVPSCYVWQGITKSAKDFFSVKSSWTFQNKELPFIKLRFDAETIKDLKNKNYCSCYEKGIEHFMNAKAVIDLSNFKGKLLLLSAEQDNYWPSKLMCDKIVNNFQIEVMHKVLNLREHYFQEYDEPIKETINFLETTRITS